ncbi:MAG: hypothetical protein ACAI38_16125 [Myxococcota bacterium]|nr:hypothetical protein [Myxococcota bacterium]
MSNFGHHDEVTPAPRSLEDALMQGALDAMLAGEFTRGRQLFAHLRGLGVCSQEVLLGLAVCADQSGDDATAKRTLDEAVSLAATGAPLSHDLYDVVRPWLPGGERARMRAEELSMSAQRFFAKL